MLFSKLVVEPSPPVVGVRVVSLLFFDSLSRLACFPVLPRFVVSLIADLSAPFQRSRSF